MGKKLKRAHVIEQGTYRRLQRSGKAYAIYIPRAFLRAIGCEDGDWLKVLLAGSKIILEKAETLVGKEGGDLE